MSTVIALAALIVALAALASARRSGRRVTQLTEMYWQLKYDHGELKATVTPPGEPEVPAPTSAFVPLGAVKRRSS
jgi:hypothetical protein